MAGLEKRGSCLLVVVIIIVLLIVLWWLYRPEPEPAKPDVNGKAEQPANAPLPSASTGVAVAVADVFGKNGLRVIGAPGIKISVSNESGKVVATATTGETTDPVFLALNPGQYTLKLDLGSYLPALPPQCIKGYAIQFEIARDQKIEFRTRVYSETVADDGQSVGKTVTGDCFKRIDR